MGTFYWFPHSLSAIESKASSGNHATGQKKSLRLGFIGCSRLESNALDLYNPAHSNSPDAVYVQTANLQLKTPNFLTSRLSSDGANGSKTVI